MKRIYIILCLLILISSQVYGLFDKRLYPQNTFYTVDTSKICMQYGTCTLTNLSVIGGYFNVSVVDTYINGTLYINGLPISSIYYNQTQSDARYVNINGDTMTGNLSILAPNNMMSKLGLHEFSELYGFDIRYYGSNNKLKIGSLSDNQFVSFLTMDRDDNTTDIYNDWTVHGRFINPSTGRVVSGSNFWVNNTGSVPSLTLVGANSLYDRATWGFRENNTGNRKWVMAYKTDVVNNRLEFHYYNGTDYYFPLYIYPNESINALLNLKGDFIGIGEETPTKKLDVAGDAYIQQDFYVGATIGNSIVMDGNDAYFQDDVEVSGGIYSPFYNWTVGDDWASFDGNTWLFNESKLSTIDTNETIRVDSIRANMTFYDLLWGNRSFYNEAYGWSDHSTQNYTKYNEGYNWPVVQNFTDGIKVSSDKKICLGDNCEIFIMYNSTLGLGVLG